MHANNLNLPGFDAGMDAYDRGDLGGALAIWRPLAEQGDLNAQCWLAYMYDNGKGVTRNFKEAIRWYRMAAEQSDAWAQYGLGNMYDKGKGVE